MIQLGPRERVSQLNNPLDELIVDALAKGQQISFRTTSGSMHPTMRSGAAFQVKRLPVNVGDIILANLDGNLTAHRLLRWNNDFAYMRGDANRTGPGESVSRNNIVGKVVHIEDDLIAKAHRLSNTIRPHIPQPVWQAIRELVRRGPGKSWGIAE